MSPWGDTLPEQLRDDISIDQQHPSARFLTASLLMAQDGSGSQGDRGADARLRPGEAGRRGGRPHFTHPGCAARAPRTQRLSDLCAPQRALDRQAREDELKFKSRQQAWPSSPDAGSPGQVASLRGSETFVVPPRCSTA